jgi:3-hydroxyacyl-[acyl-carrier-protein] dehydratase
MTGSWRPCRAHPGYAGLGAMMWNFAEAVDRELRRAAKEPLVPALGEAAPMLLDRRQIEGLIPHRDPFLFVDQVVLLDNERKLIATRYRLERSAAIFAGHFPDRPLWPGVLQIEAIGQAGLLLCVAQPDAPRPPEPILTHVLGALFVRPVLPRGDILVAAHVIEDGFFTVVVGQCFQDNEICSATCLKISF